MVVLLPELFSSSTEITSSSKTKSFCWCRVYRSTAQPTRSNAEKAHGIVIKEIAVLISAFGTDDSAMEHGIDVIRAAFECAHLQSPVNQRLQHSAGNSGFAAAAVGSGEKYSGNRCFQYPHFLLPRNRLGNGDSLFLCQRQKSGVDLVKVPDWRSCIQHQSALLQNRFRTTVQFLRNRQKGGS